MTHEATWSGGPWHGITIDVVRGGDFVPIYGSSPRMCPVLLDSTGQWIIHWDAGEIVD